MKKEIIDRARRTNNIRAAAWFGVKAGLAAAAALAAFMALLGGGAQLIAEGNFGTEAGIRAYMAVVFIVSIVAGITVGAIAGGIRYDDLTREW